MFEILECDLAGRAGIIHTNHGKVRTPAYVPVIHPVRQAIPASDIRAMGFEMAITNAYIARKNHGNDAGGKKIHEIIGFEGAVMTDSGGYQVLEYGDLEVTPEEMASFESHIDSDIAIPLDKPTGYGLAKAEAGRFVDYTLKVSRNTLEEQGHDRIWAGPVQGGEHLGLVAKSAKKLIEYGYKMLALGSPVEFMESYEYKLLAQMIAAAKKGIPPSIPLHLFGAGHPLTIPLAVSLGCDTFDSASYMLYAKHDRYITADGTRHLSGIAQLACYCPVCSAFTASELRELDRDARIVKIALHNLHAIKAEVDRTREAIHEGRLWEYTMQKARAHPRLFEATPVLCENKSYLARSTPLFKKRAVFLFSLEDQFRPEVARYHDMVRRFDSKKSAVCITPQMQMRPAYLSPQYTALRRKLKEPKDIQFCQYDPILGIIPLELSDLFPAAHYVSVRDEFNPAECAEFGETWRIFMQRNSFARLYYDAADPFLAYYAKKSKGVRRKAL